LYFFFSYSNLKKLIYSIEKEKVTKKDVTSADVEDAVPTERTALIPENPIEVDNQQFIEALNKSLDKIVKFYAKKETELYDEMEELIGDFEGLDKPELLTAATRRFSAGEQGESHDDQEVRSNTNQVPRRESMVEGDSFLPANIISKNVAETDPEQNRVPLLQRRGSLKMVSSWPRESIDDVVELKKRTVDLFVLLSELKSFVALNTTAFAKILKKYDKITNNNLKRYYTSAHVGKAYPFLQATKTRLNERIQQTERAYAILATDNNLDVAIEELKTHLREHIVWERNTVWRDLIGQERRTQTVGLSDAKPSSIYTPFGTVRVTREQILNYLFMIACVAVFIILLKVEIFETVEENRCLAILVFASMLWAGEVCVYKKKGGGECLYMYIFILLHVRVYIYIYYRSMCVKYVCVCCKYMYIYRERKVNGILYIYTHT
jgi:phosphate transporter